MLAPLALLAMLGAGAAEAQTSVTLVGNTGQPNTSVSGLVNDHAQAFTTGSHGTGYKLTGVNIQFTATAGAVPTYTVSIHEDSSGSPGTAVSGGTLTNPASLPSGGGLAQYSASGSGIDLDANTTYWVVLDVSANPNISINVGLTSSDAEDAGAATGWSIADTSRARGHDQTAWTSSNNARRIAIQGFSTVPTVTGVAITSDPGADLTYQAGDVIRVTVTFSMPVTVDTSGGTPALTMHFRGGGFPAQRDKQAPYASGSGTNALVFAYTVQSADDSDTTGVGLPATRIALNGGTIKSVTGNVDATLTYNAVGHDTDHKVDGPTARDTTAPAVSTTTPPTVNGATLVITFDETLDTGTDWVPAPEAFHVTVGSERRNVAAAGVAVAGSAVTLTLESAVIDADTVKVRYDKPADNPLRDFTAGNEVASFGDQAVTNNTPNVAPTVTGATFAGDRLVITFSEPLDTASVPATGAFTVTAGGTAQSVTNVAVSGNRVTLTLQSAIGAGQTVTVGYTQPTGATDAKLRDRAATPNLVATFSGQSVMELTAFQSAATLGASVVAITFTRQIQHWGRAVDYTVEVDGTPRTVSSAFQASQGRVGLNVAPPIEAGQTVTVSYAQPASGSKLTDDNGNEVEGFTRQPVSNRVPAVPSGAPTVNRAQLVIAFNAALGTGSVPAPGDFAVTVAGAARDVASGGVALSGRQVRLTLASAVSSGQAVRVSYTAGTDPLRDAAGNLIASFGPLDVTNNTRRPRPPPPPPPRDTAPVADAGADLEVDPESAVTLDGSGSRDADGDRLSFAWSQVSGEAVTLSNAGTARASFDAPVEPGALVFRLTVSDPDGRTHSDEVTVTVRDLVPDFGGATVAALTLTLGEAMEPAVLPEATGGNGELSYGLTSEPAGLAGLSFDPATRTLSGTPSAGGSFAFAYRADDADSNLADSDAAVLRFEVTVETVLDGAREAVRRALKRTLAAVGTRTLTGALANIGARFGDGFAGSSLTLAGQSVPLGMTGKTSDGMVGDGLSAAGMHGSCAAAGHGRYGLGRHGLGQGGFGTGVSACAGGSSRAVGADELFHASAFTVRLGAAPSDANADPRAAQWALWGRGDLGSFEGRPEPGMRYEGETRTGWLGFDGRSGPWVAGLAVSHGESEAEYGFDLGGGIEGSGRLETKLTAVYPYGRWTFADGLELRGVLGAGSGEARHVPEGGERETSDLGMRMASVGVRRALPAIGGMDLAARGDASLVRMEIGGGPETISGVSADSWRARAGVEASRRFALDAGSALVPFVEAAARRDGGDGLTGTGLEVAGGVRYSAPGLQVEARGRWLAAHTEEGARERGLSVTARYGPGAHGRGLSLSLSPRWGSGAGAAEALWGDEMPRGPGGGADAGAVDARIGYGIGLTPHGLLTPFAETGLAGDEHRRLRLGTRFEAFGADLGVELAGERRESGAAEPEHAVRLGLRLGF